MIAQPDRYSRQSFLGPEADQVIASAVIGVVGLGGGGSQVVQQLAHIGFLNYVIYDPDIAEESNLNRLIGARVQDLEHPTPKIEIAARTIRSLQPLAHIRSFPSRWQDNPGPLRTCDIIVACVDGFAERRELETCARRYLIPLIDIGMDVHQVEDQPPRMGGQVILSMPGHPCMQCVGFLNDNTLAQEAARYGAAGPRPQVVWPNGILASTAVGLVVDLLTDWTESLRAVAYYSYDGNRGTLQPHVRLKYFDGGACPHHPLSMIGDTALG